MEQPFSLDGSASPLPPVASFIIASNLSKAAKVLFWTAHVCFLTCLLLLKTRLAFLRSNLYFFTSLQFYLTEYSSLTFTSVVEMNVFRVPVVGLLLENLLVYISCDNLFKPLLLWQLWTAHGKFLAQDFFAIRAWNSYFLHITGKVQ